MLALYCRLLNLKDKLQDESLVSEIDEALKLLNTIIGERYGQ